MGILAATVFDIWAPSPDNIYEPSVDGAAGPYSSFDTWAPTAQSAGSTIVVVSFSIKVFEFIHMNVSGVDDSATGITFQPQNNTDLRVGDYDGDGDPWRILMMFDTVGSNGTVLGAWLQLAGVPFPLNAGPGGDTSVWVRRGNEGEGLGLFLSTADWNAFQDPGWVLAGTYALKNPTGVRQLSFNGAGLAELQAALDGGDELHVTMKALDENDMVGKWWRVQSDAATNPSTRPKLFAVIDQVPPALFGFPGKSNRSMLEFMSP